MEAQSKPPPQTEATSTPPPQAPPAQATPAPSPAEPASNPAPAQVDGPPALSVEQVRAAIEHDRLVVFSQPIQDLRTGAVASEELLVRMQTPDGQLIQPFAFLATAEAFGLASEIDSIMIDRGLQLAREGRRVSVNLSAHSLSEPGLMGRVEQAIATGMDPGNITFEISENSAGTDMEAAKDLAIGLTKLGCDLAVDDFGIGFGTLQFVKHLPAQIIKVGREFVRDLPRSLDDYHVMGCIVDLATKLGRKTAAVGVEDGLTLELLKRLGVDYAQGFFIGEPRELDFDKPRSLEPAATKND
jgi:EAL domain-containing protein (putative c-di-GMP-specific phosphodiesterase class I)